MTNFQESIGQVKHVVVESRRPFGVFVSMEGMDGALIEMFHMCDDPAVRVTEENMPTIGQNLTAIIVGVRKSGQYELSLRKKDFAQFGRMDQWQDWKTNPKP